MIDEWKGANDGRMNDGWLWMSLSFSLHLSKLSLVLFSRQIPMNRLCCCWLLLPGCNQVPTEFLFWWSGFSLRSDPSRQTVFNHRHLKENNEYVEFFKSSFYPLYIFVVLEETTWKWNQRIFSLGPLSLSLPNCHYRREFHSAGQTKTSQSTLEVYCQVGFFDWTCACLFSLCSSPTFCTLNWKQFALSHPHVITLINKSLPSVLGRSLGYYAQRTCAMSPCCV